MSAATAMFAGLHGAWRLARGRADGLNYIEADMAGAVRSFWALAVCLPAFVCLRLLAWGTDGAPPDAIHTLMLDILTFVAGWCGFAVASFRVVGALGLAPAWPRFIALWNWCNVVQYLLLVVFGLPGLFGVPELLNEAAQLFALGWALWLEWFAFRLALEVSGATAAGLVALDVAIGVALAAVSAAFAAG